MTRKLAKYLLLSQVYGTNKFGDMYDQFIFKINYANRQK